MARRLAICVVVDRVKKKPATECGVKLASGQVLEDSGASRNDIDLLD